MSKFEVIEKDFQNLNKKISRQDANLEQSQLVETIDLSSEDQNDLARERILADLEEGEASQDSSELGSHSSEEESQEAMVDRPVINFSQTLMTVNPSLVKWMML